MIAHFLNQSLAVVAFVAAEGDPIPARNLLYHRERRLSFGAPGSLRHAAVYRQSIAILHQHVARVTKFGFLAEPLAGQARLRVGGRLVSFIAALLAVKVYTRNARIIVGRRSLRRFTVFAFETLLPGPRFNQSAVNREVLIGKRRKASLAGRLGRAPPRRMPRPPHPSAAGHGFW